MNRSTTTDPEPDHHKINPRKKRKVKTKPFIVRRKKAFLSILSSLVIILLDGTLVL